MRFTTIMVEPTEVEAITFEEFIEYGKNNSTNIVYGLPWSFYYKGFPVTHENNERYLICATKRIYNFTPKDMLITDENGDIYLCDIDVFNKFYKKVKIDEI